MGIPGWISLIMGVSIVAVIVWYTVKGWVKYPEERGKGSVDGNNWSNPGSSINGPF